MLAVRDLEARYGDTQVLYGVTFEVGAGEVVSLLGRNGMGKTTTVRSVMGLTRASSGSVRLLEHDLTRAPSHRIVRAGIGLVPEGRQIFPNLSTRENLEVARPGNGRASRGGHRSADQWTVERVFALFPGLAERSGNDVPAFLAALRPYLGSQLRHAFPQAQIFYVDRDVARRHGRHEHHREIAQRLMRPV